MSPTVSARFRSVCAMLVGVVLLNAGCDMTPASASDPISQFVTTLLTFLQDFGRQVAAALLF